MISNIRKKRFMIIAIALFVYVVIFMVHAHAQGNVSGAIESSWTSAKGQIKEVVNKVVFPVIDMVLAIFFFVKLGTAYFDCAPVKAL